jgi:2-polyprenyl-6-hydroxyphenyl methylase/3-demethylubiquinone-9 3-methyltransferase
MNQLNLDNDEIARYAATAAHWWDRNGELKALHEVNPLRIQYVLDRADIGEKPVLDVGCGGGIVSEALAAAGARVTGIDMAAPALGVARAHARENGYAIDYREATAEAFAQLHPEQYAVVTCMELVEHVPDPASIIQACADLVKPGGHLFFTTVNRTWLARLLVIWAAEYVLGIVSRGTHTYSRFIRPEEMVQWGATAGLRCEDVSGMRYIPFAGYAALCKSTAMNYLMHFVKPAGP